VEEYGGEDAGEVYAFGNEAPCEVALRAPRKFKASPTEIESLQRTENGGREQACGGLRAQSLMPE